MQQLNIGNLRYLPCRTTYIRDKKAGLKPAFSISIIVIILEKIFFPHANDGHDGTGYGDAHNLEETIFIVLKRQWHIGPPQAKDNGRYGQGNRQGCQHFHNHIKVV